MTQSQIDHSECAGYLRGAAAALGCDVIVSTEPPIVVGPYTKAPFVCPHGARFWLEPSGEQIAEWVRDGVR